MHTGQIHGSVVSRGAHLRDAGLNVACVVSPLCYLSIKSVKKAPKLHDKCTFLCNIMHSIIAFSFAAVGVSPVSRSSPSVPSTPSSTQKTPPATAPPANPLASILSRVDINTNTLLSALSKTQAHGGFQGENWKSKMISKELG